MARSGGRATSRFTHEIWTCPREILTSAVWLCFCLSFLSTAEAGLYNELDHVIILTPENVNRVLVNCPVAALVEFYVSWCGHCINFAPLVKDAAQDIIEWGPAVKIAVVDCSEGINLELCRNYKVQAFPTLKFFPAYSANGHLGQPMRGIHSSAGLRRALLDKLLENEAPAPPACPPLEFQKTPEVNSFFENNNVQFLALIFEDQRSYIGREVILDMLQFENIAVRRVENTEEDLVSRLGVTEFPSCYLYDRQGNVTRLRVNAEARILYTYALRMLPGVYRSGIHQPGPRGGTSTSTTEEPWRPFNRSRVYMADLESALHYSLRVELGTHDVIEGEALNALKNYTSVLAKYFPGRQIVVNLLTSLNSFLSQTSEGISYKALREVIDNKAQFPYTALPEGRRWVGCQSSQPNLRRYPCGLWTLFHVLTVAAMNSGSTDLPLEVLNAMRGYVHNFFGCRYCADHFELMAKASMNNVKTLSSATLWLWSSHNKVNRRLAVDLTEDPDFPKIQWPSPDLCPRCHTVSWNREHMWDQDQVLAFLQSYFSSSTILQDYLEPENEVLAKQEQEHRRQQALESQRKERRAREIIPPSPSPPPEEEEEEEEDEEEEPQNEAVAHQETEPEGATEIEANFPHQARTGKEDGQSLTGGHQKKPIIVGRRKREAPEEIVDLDLFVNQHYKARALRMAASEIKQRTLQRKVEQEPRSEFRLGMELDTGLGMVGLQPVDTDFELSEYRHKRDLAGRFLEEEEVELNHRGRWMLSLLSIGFSRLDISLCVFLYSLSCMCLLAMYLFFKNRLRLRRAKFILS